MEAFLINLALSVLAVAALMLVCLTWSIKKRDWSLIDILWGLGFVLIAVVSFVTSSLTTDDGDSSRQMAMLLVTSAWGLRLATHLLVRSRRQGEDPRYTALMKRREGSEVRHAIMTILWPQGRIMLFVSLPIQLAMYQSSSLDAVAWAGIGLASFGIAFEATADAQLARFRSDTGNAGAIMNRGLWSWSRHPNYFGEACVLFGIWGLACGHWTGWLAVVCPVYMVYRLINRNGKALLERRMSRSRGEAYAEYVARTSGFVPWPPRRHVTTGQEQS